jgi:hypothetical protein
VFKYYIWICSLNFLFGSNSFIPNSIIMNHLQIAIQCTPAMQTAIS